MSTTIKSLQGTLESDGTVRLREPFSVAGPRPVLVNLAIEEDDEESTPGLTPEWAAEIEKRNGEIDNGEVGLIDADDFIARLKSA